MEGNPVAEVGPAEVLHLTDHEFQELGVNTIGEMAMIRQHCREFVTETTVESPVVQRVKAFQANRKRRSWRSENGHTNKASTRRFKIGWKNKSRSSPYRLISAGKGGGTHDYDADINATLNQLKMEICHHYFPNGKNENQSIDLSQVDCYLANFSGEPLPEKIGDEEFTVDAFYKSRKTHPIRVYLHTVTKDDAVSTSSITSDNTTVNAELREELTMSDMPDFFPDENSETDMPIYESGTPTIIFQRLPQPMTEDDVHPGPSGLSSSFGHDAEAPSTESLHDILLRLSRQVVDKRSNIVNVSRFDVLQGAIRGFNRKSFNPARKLSVKFTDELGIDGGGPTREFLRLMMAELAELPVFRGPENSKLLDLHQPSLQENTYKLVGRMMAYSIVHGGPTPSFLHPLLYEALVHGIHAVEPTPEDIMDYDIKQQVIRLLHAEDTQPFEDLIQMAGCFSLAQRTEQRPQLCKAITKFIVFGRLHECFEQLCEGLGVLGVLREVKAHENRMRELFVFENKTLDAASMELLFQVQLSDPDSNQRRSEEIVLANWRDFLLDLEDSATLKDLLIFATGADGIPPLGFQPSASLKFHSASPQKPEDTCNFPYANTCANVLSLPLLENFENFKHNMMAGVNITQFTTE